MNTMERSDVGARAHDRLGASARRLVLVGDDLCAWSDEAVVKADAWARAADADLAVCHVTGPDLRSDPLFPQSVQAETLDLVARSAQKARIEQARTAELTGREPGDFEVVIESGSPAVAVLEAAERLGAALLVVGAHPEKGLRRVLGSSAELIVRRASCSVLVARVHATTNHILVATDLSQASLPALDAACARARETGARLTVVHSLDVMPDPLVAAAIPLGASWVTTPREIVDATGVTVMQMLDALLHARNTRGSIRITEGHAATAVLRVASSVDADLVVVGTHGHAGLRRLVLGSVAEAIVRAAQCSVLVVR
jgi:nucleotide-binding universal stress UspA family protein